MIVSQAELDRALRIVETGEAVHWLDDEDLGFDVYSQRCLRVGRALVLSGLMDLDCREPIETAGVLPYIKSQKRRVEISGMCEMGCTRLERRKGALVCPTTRQPCRNSDPEHVAAVLLFRELEKISGSYPGRAYSE